MLRRVILWVGLLTAVCGSTASAQDVMRWESDIATAQRTAAQTNRLVLVHFGATWCGPCKEMENTVFNQPGLGTALNPYYVGVKIDVDAQPALAKQLQVGPIPCDIVMTPQGQIVARNEGKKPAGEYVTMLNRAAQQARAIQGAAPTAAPAPVAAAPAAAMPAPQNAPYSPYAVPTQPPAASPYGAALAAATAPVAAPTTTAPPTSLVGSRYSTVYTPPAGAPTLPTNASLPAPTSVTPPQTTTTTSTPTVAAPAPVAPTNSAAATSGLGPRYAATSVGDRYATLPTAAPAVAPAPAAPSVLPRAPAATNSVPMSPAPSVAAATTAPTTTAVPTTTTPAAGSSTVGSRYAATSVGDRYAAMPSNTSPIATQNPSPAVTANVTPPTTKPTTIPPTVTPPTITPSTTSTQTMTAQTMSPPAAVMSKPADVAAAPVKPAPMENSKPLGGPVAPKPSVDASAQTFAGLQAEIPPGSPPLALDGYCPVTVTEKMVWKRGDAAFGAIHKDRTYLFVSAAEQQKFLAKPDLYSPIISGNDPVAVVEEARLVPGKRDIGMKCGDQMILFSSKENYEKFKRDQQRYMLGLQQAMQAGGTLRR